MIRLNETHDQTLESWIESANSEQTDFKIQNLPYASIRRKHSSEAFRIGIALGDQVIDLKALFDLNILDGLDEQIKSCSFPFLNEFMALDFQKQSELRLGISRIFRKDQNILDDQALLQVSKILIPMEEIEYQLPCQITDYTDFYTSIYHATKVGSLFRPDNPLLPNYKWVPIGYHGRASSIAVSGVDFPRPKGQIKLLDKEHPQLSPCNRLDYELEIGIVIGKGNLLGTPISIEDAESHVFGLCLFNDWSARDIQAWEYQPLGPFLAKNFLSTLSPWIVTLEALAPYRQAWTRAKEDPQPLDYLESEENRRSGSFDIQLAVFLETEAMRRQGVSPERLSITNFKHSYWTIAQLIAHHSVNGCNLQTGDLFGSGTQSGPDPKEAGSLLELSNGGKSPILLSNGEKRYFLEDGDRVILKGYCKKKGFTKIGFGEASATVLPTK